MAEMTCPTCGGSGTLPSGDRRKPDTTCGHCGGSGTVRI